MCVHKVQSEETLDIPVSVRTGKVIFNWEYSDGTGCWFGIIYLPRAVTVNLPCETKSTGNYLKESLP